MKQSLRKRAAYAADGNFEQAVEFQEQALKKALPIGFPAVEAKRRLKLYEQKRPYQERLPSGDD